MSVDDDEVNLAQAFLDAVRDEKLRRALSMVEIWDGEGEELSTWAYIVITRYALYNTGERGGGWFLPYNGARVYNPYDYLIRITEAKRQILVRGMKMRSAMGLERIAAKGQDLMLRNKIRKYRELDEERINQWYTLITRVMNE